MIAPIPMPCCVGEPTKVAVVVDRVPRDVQGNAGTCAGEPVHECGVGDPFLDRTRGARPGVDVEARARVAVAPGRRLDLEPAQLFEGGGLVHGRESAPFAANLRMMLSIAAVSKVIGRRP